MEREVLSTFDDGRESAGLVCTEDTAGAATFGILEKYLKIMNAFYKVDILHKVQGDVRIF